MYLNAFFIKSFTNIILHQAGNAVLSNWCIKLKDVQMFLRLLIYYAFCLG